MYTTRPGLLIGFDGCDKDFCDKAVNHQASFRRSTNKYDWLGHGIYFWENNAERALKYAKELRDNPRRNGPKIKTPAVLGAVIDLQNCLDLLDSKYLHLAQISYKTLKETYEAVGKELPSNKTPKGAGEALLRELDCAVIENVHNINPDMPFDSVRGVFIEGNPLYAGTGFNEKNHIQICIRNLNCIKGFFFPRREHSGHSKFILALANHFPINRSVSHTVPFAN